jgi:hypothetical protein
MRSVRLDRRFDAVFVHDAVVYMTSLDDLRQVVRTAHRHCRPGGVALFAPDFTAETFRPGTSHGGHDRPGRSARYLQWTWDPDASDSRYVSYMVYLLREGLEDTRCVVDRHDCGMFSIDDWLHVMREVGFQARAQLFEHTEVEPGSTYVFIGRKDGENTVT